MSMFCYQCQETAKNTGCTERGVCGKRADTANLQDLLLFVLKGISYYGKCLDGFGIVDGEAGLFVAQGLFATITNANFDNERILSLVRKGLEIRDRLRGMLEDTCRARLERDGGGDIPECAVWSPSSEAEMLDKAAEAGVLRTENEDVRSLRELLVYGVKGLSAYTDHAAVLGYKDDDILRFIMEALDSTNRDLGIDEMVAMVMRAGEHAVKAMALLDRANTETYGHPEITSVNIGVRNNPGILISGHDLRDMADLLEQTKDTGVDVYTHSEMLPANYYHAFKKYDHFVGNYGSSWWHQQKEFESFNGPILMTTNCIVPVKESYRDRLFTTGMAGYPGVAHIADRGKNARKDFSKIIELAGRCEPPRELETGEIVGGFAHNQVLALADKVVEAVKSGKIKRFVVMAGCDGRQAGRNYFTDVAGSLPDDTVILTAGCAKYRYNKLGLGDIAGIPRVLDAGQCNDSYSLAVVALKLKEVFELDDVNDLPLAFDIAWYEQKAVAVLLALLHLGFKGMRLGPTLPAFLSPGVAKVLVENFDIKPTGTVEEDVAAMMEGK